MEKKSLRKLFASLLVTTLTVGLITGCGKGTTPVSGSVDTNTTKEAAEDVTTIYAATGGNPKPFTFVNDDNELQGQNIELIQAVFDRLPQYKLEIEVTDFASIFAGLDSDRYQIGVNNFAMNDERKEKYLFSDPIFANEYVAIFAKKDDTAKHIESWSDLGGLKTISQAGINITTALENYNKANKDNPVTIEYSEEDLVLQIQDVEAGKYDFVLMDKPMFEYYQNEFGFDVTGVSIGSELSSELMQEPYSYLLVSAGHEELVKDINGALKEVIEGGTSKKINEKWFGSDYSPSSDER